MSPSRAKLRIAGQRVPSRSGLEFELEARDGSGTVRGPWPRAGAADLSAARAAASAAGEAWRRRPRSERLEILLAALGDLESRLQTEVAPALAPALGREAGALERLLGEDLFRARESLELLREGGPPAARGAGLFVNHWGDLLGSLVARMGRRLLEGSTAVVVADPLVPEAAELAVDALERAGADDGVVNLLVDSGRELARLAFEGPGHSWVRLRGSRRELRRLERSSGPESFGAGLVEWECWPLTSRVHLVGREEDPVAAARSVAAASLEPDSSLFGQLPDRIGRVLVHRRSLSAFTAALLECLDGSPALARAVPLVEPGRFAWLSEAWSLGLDEGAAPIFGEAPSDADRHEDGSESASQALTSAPAPSEHRPRAPRRVRPIVFTNVDAAGRLLWLEEPGPLLRLCRVDSDDHGHALKLALERGVAPDTDPATRKSQP